MDNPFNRGYFEGGAYVGLYTDFPVHYNTVKIIQKRQPESVIDIGGARGYIIKKLNDVGIPGVCMDVSKHCYHTRATDSFVLHDATMTQYPFKDKQFDLAISISVLEHIPEDKIPTILKEIARISKRGLHGISFGSNLGDIDKTHINMHPLEWWQEKFKESCPEYHYEILDKEETEKGNVELPKSDNLVKLNIGSFINMFHYGWINTDTLDLGNFANNNGYIFRQLDTYKNLPYRANSIDLIIASHFLEHLDRTEGRKFLSNCLRSLKPNGIIRITVPDAELIVKKYIDNSISDYADVNIGVEKSPDSAHSLFELLLSGHKTIYDLNSLSFLLSDVGFVNIEKQPFNKSYSKEIETQTIDSYPTLSLYIEAQKSDMKDSDKANDKLRVALVSTPFFTLPPKGYSGLEQVVWDLAEALDEMGHDVTLFAPEGSKATKNGHLITTGPSVSTVNIDWFEEEKRRYEIYKQYINSQNFDICHDHTWFAFPYLLKENDSQLKILHTHHGGFNWDSTPPCKPNLVAISQFMRDYTVQYFKQRGYNTDCRFIYNGIDLDKYPYQFNKTEHLLFVGRLSTFKRPHIAVELARNIDHKLDIVGGTFVDSNEYVTQLDKMVENDQNIQIYKDVSHDFKIEKMQNAKALIFPSKLQEPFGLVALEAMACGTPVIAMRDGAIAEVVKHNETGFICDHMSDMIEAIRNIHTIDPKNCRKRAEQLSRQIMAENYIKLYRRILNNDEW